MDYELKFDPKTIEHLGVKMYSTLPPALAELISNAYDADAELVEVTFHEHNSTPVSITVKDDGYGMSSEDIQNKFLVIGRNRRTDGGDQPSPKYRRLPTGKKGLGKLALFGLAKKIVLDAKKNGKRNRFELDWEKLLASENVYSPTSDIEDEPTPSNDGTSITLRDLKRKSPFDLDAIADNLSKIFIVDDNFKILLKKTDGQKVEVTNERRYAQIEQQFTWLKADIELKEYEYEDSVEFCLITGENPIKPSSGLRGITIFSRGKLVNAPEFFSDSTSSHFYQYLTGWIKADFIDLLDEDVISTNRQALNWEDEKMSEFREWLSDLVSKVGISWRDKRKAKKDQDFEEKTGIDKGKWLSTMSDEVKSSAEEIVNMLVKDEGINESYSPVVVALHKIIPEFPDFHWRHLHEDIQSASRKGYESQDYYSAFLESMKRYANRTREYSGSEIEKDFNLMGSVFGADEKKLLHVATGFLRANGTKFSESTLTNIENSQQRLSQGVIEGGRNVVAHEESLDLSASGLFTDADCLDLLSMVSYLMQRLEHAKMVKDSEEWARLN